MTIKTKILRILLIIRSYRKSLKLSKHNVLITQQKMSEIALSAIKHKDADLRIDIETGKRYLSLNDIYIDFENDIITVTNHINHYNITMPFEVLSNIQKEFDKENSRRCRKIEYEKKINITNSLDEILNSITAF